MVATTVERLKTIAAQLLREANRLTGERPREVLLGWTAERAISASFGFIWADSVAWALFEREFTEGRRSTRANSPTAVAREGNREKGVRRGTPHRVPVSYQRHDQRDGKGRFRPAARAPVANPPAVRDLVANSPATVVEGPQL